MTGPLASGAWLSTANIVLTPGDWDVRAGFVSTAGGTSGYISLSSVYNTVNTTGGYLVSGMATPEVAIYLCVGPSRFSTAANLTVYANCYVGTAATGVTVTINARRVR